LIGRQTKKARSLQIWLSIPSCGGSFSSSRFQPGRRAGIPERTLATSGDGSRVGVADVAFGVDGIITEALPQLLAELADMPLHDAILHIVAV